MHHQDEPQGCFHTVSYGLLGLGLYAACSLFSCFGLATLIWQMNLNPKVPIGSEYSFPTLLDIAGFSFLCVGPLMVILYVLYLEDIWIIQVEDSAPPISQKAEKRKKAR